MWRQVAHCSVRHTRGAPCCGFGRVSKEVFGVFAAEPRDVTNHSIRNKLARILAGGGPNIVKRNHVDRACGIGRIDHRTAVL